MTSDMLERRLREESEGLLYMSESDYPLEPFVWSKEKVGADRLTPVTLAHCLRSTEGIETVDFETFFAPMTEEEDWFGPEEKEAALRFRQLTQTLKENLTDLTVYKLGAKAKREVYIVGKTAAGDFAGLKTRVVET